MKLVLKFDKEFMPALRSLEKRGARYLKAANTIRMAMQRAETGDDFLLGLKPTKNKEDRVAKCRKYDLNDYCRLITIHTEGCCVFTYCGDHTQSERWLKTNTGYIPIVDSAPDKKVVTRTYASVSADPAMRIGGQAGRSVGALSDRLNDELFEKLIAKIPRKLVKQFEAFESTTFESEMWTAISQVDGEDQRVAIYDVFALLRQDKAREATDRAKLFLGEVISLADLPVEDLPATIDSDLIRTIDPRTKSYSTAVKRFLSAATYRDWMLFMHADQDAIVREDFNGPAKLIGVSGSGKTCVVVQRALRLAATYPGERILILTLNRALAHLIDKLVDACCAPEIRHQIEVKPFFVLCRDLLVEREPKRKRFYDEVTWKSNEHIDEVWQEYYRCEVNNYDARVLNRLHDSLTSRGWNAEGYLRDEFDWIRSALSPAVRGEYLGMARSGRIKALIPEWKSAVLEGLSKWEEKMEQVGVIDTLGIAQALYKYVGGLEPRYRCILVDEGQDFGNIELRIIRGLVKPAINDLFICGDAAQAVTTKYQLLKDAGIDVHGTRSRSLQLNYRNSRDILLAAHQVLYNNLADEMYDRKDFDFLHPEFSAWSGSTPLLLEGPGLKAEIRHAVALCKELLGNRSEGKACIAICGFTLYELSRFGEKIGIPVLDGATDLDQGGLFLSDLEQTKGFEFDVVCVLNCAAGILPSNSAPESEWWRDVTRLYVAMTRAKSELIISWSGEKSPFFAQAEDHFLSAPWSEYSSEGLAGAAIIPKHLESHRKVIPNWRKMSGEQFIYTDHALGLPLELIAKIRKLVPGPGQALNKGRDPILWSTMGTAADDLKSARVRGLWGPEGSAAFADLVSRLDARTSGPKATQE